MADREASRQFLRRQIEQSLAAKRAFLENDGLFSELMRACQMALETYRRGHKVLIAGNGGSAADAQHIAGELVSRFFFDRPGLAALALTTDSSILTAIGNDYGFEKLFSRQIEANGQPGDLFMAISTSGNSPNILMAIEASRKKGISVLGLTGRDGGRMASLCDCCLIVPSDSTPRIQEGHILIGHLVAAHVEQELFGGIKPSSQ